MVPNDISPAIAWVLVYEWTLLGAKDSAALSFLGGVPVPSPRLSLFPAPLSLSLALQFSLPLTGLQIPSAGSLPPQSPPLRLGRECNPPFTQLANVAFTAGLTIGTARLMRVNWQLGQALGDGVVRRSDMGPFGNGEEMFVRVATDSATPRGEAPQATRHLLSCLPSG